MELSIPIQLVLNHVVAFMADFVAEAAAVAVVAIFPVSSLVIININITIISLSLL